MLWINCILICTFSYALTFCVLKFVNHFKVLDVPNVRSSHSVPTPRGGGISIVIAFLTAAFILFWQNKVPHELFYTLFLGGIAFAAIGFCDDVFNLSIKIRISLQFIFIALALFYLSVNFSLSIFFFAFAWVSWVWWINLFNFMDGIDGLAASESIFLSLTLCAISYFYTNIDFELLLYFAAAISGFLPWNWSPAKIFLGDSGSYFLAYILGCFAFYNFMHQTINIPQLCILAGVFICDATFTLIYRMLKKQNWYRPHREHAYQALIKKGLSHKVVSMLLIIINCCLLLPIFTFMISSARYNWPVAIGTACVLFLFWYHAKFIFKEKI